MHEDVKVFEGHSILNLIDMGTWVRRFWKLNQRNLSLTEVIVGPCELEQSDMISPEVKIFGTRIGFVLKSQNV